MWTFQFDLYEAIVWKGAKNQWSAVHPVSWMKERAREKLFENNPGSISCKALFIVENHVQRCWLTRGFKIIAEEHKFLKFYSLAGDRSRGSSRLKINCVETKVSSEPMNFSDLMGIVDCCMGDYGWRERGRLIFKRHFTESECNVVYGRKNLSLRLQQSCCASLYLFTRISN